MSQALLYVKVCRQILDSGRVKDMYKHTRLLQPMFSKIDKSFKVQALLYVKACHEILD
jgi:hypothetical protein